MNGSELIAQERKRQLDEEGYSSKHDDEHTSGELAMAAACYAAPERIFVREDFANQVSFADPWPWDRTYDARPYNGNVVGVDRLRAHRVRTLVKAGALIAAEIDRLLRRGERRGRKSR